MLALALEATMWTALLFATAALAQDADFRCLTAEGEAPLGPPPLDVTCTLSPRIDGTWTGVTWLAGTGDVFEGNSFSFTYVDPGQYSVSVTLEDFESSDPPLRR